MVRKRPRDATKYIVNESKVPGYMHKSQSTKQTDSYQALQHKLVEVKSSKHISDLDRELLEKQSQPKYVGTQKAKNNKARNWVIGFLSVLFLISAGLLMIGKYYMQSF